ncbi:MAG: TonB-dependent receptor [Bacteroidota bacterium]
MSIGTSYTRSKIACAVVAMMLLTAQTLFAQGSGTLNGRVLDKETGEALVGANVIVANTNLGAAADIDGKFTIHDVPAGKVTLKVSYIGYRPTTVDITMTENGTVEQEIRLAAGTVIGETVVVTAQARGQLSSINQQLASTSIINVVSAEKMKELPDANIAESIGRLPGISVQRNAGEADAVTIRGMAAQFNEVTIEGIPMSSTNYTDRGIDLSLLGDDLVKGVEVSKTLRPDMDADALGGTVNLTLKTAQPGFHYDIWGNGGYTKIRSSYDNYKFAGSVGDRFADDKIGVLVQGNIEEKQLPSDQQNATYNSGQKSSVVANTFFVQTASTELTDNTTQRHRYGGSLILDYASDLVNVKLFSVYEQKNDSNITRDNTTNFTSDEFYDQVFVNDTKTEQRTNSIQALFKLGGTELPISFSYNKSDSYTPNGMEFDFYQTGVATTPKLNQLAYGQPLPLINQMGVFAPGNVNSLLNNINVSNSNLSDADYDAKVDWKVPFKLSDYISGKLSVGGKYHSVDRTSAGSEFQYYMQYGDGAPTRNAVASFTNLFPVLATLSKSQLENDQTGVPAVAFVDPSYSKSTILGYPIGPNWLVPNLVTMTNDLASVPGAAVWQNGVSDYDQTYTDKENTRAGYVMGEFNISDLTIVPGARYQEEKTDISAYHIQPVTANANGLGYPPNLVESKTDNPYWFPSVNIKYKATENVQVMGAIYRSVSLPSYAQLSPELEFQTPGFNLGGNPLLKPSTASNYDLGASLFSNSVGLFTVDLFYKDISNLIYNMQNYYPYAPYPVAGAPSDISSRLPGKNYFDSTYLNLNKQANRLLNGSIPMNDPADAFLRGIEISWQTHFWYLPGLLSGIVLEVNASFMSSDQEYPYFKPLLTKLGSIDTLLYSNREGALQNQPKAIYNAILGWDYKGFSSRFSFEYQELTLQSLDTQYGLEDSYYGNVLLFDIALKQQLIENLYIFANATNVNNHIDSYYFNHPAYLTTAAGSLPTSGQTYGLDAQFGLTFSF